MRAVKNWTQLDIKEKINLTKNALKIHYDKDLCKLLEITPRTLQNWKVGKTSPSKKILEKLHSLYTSVAWGSELYGKDAFIAQYTIAYDSVRHVFKDLISSEDAISTSNAVHAVCVKLAAAITERCTHVGCEVLIQMHSIYNSTDYGEVMNISNINHQNKTVDICVKLGILDNTPELVYIMECVNEKGIVQDRRASYVSDLAISKAATLVYKFLKQ